MSSAGSPTATPLHVPARSQESPLCGGLRDTFSPLGLSPSLVASPAAAAAFRVLVGTGACCRARAAGAVLHLKAAGVMFGNIHWVLFLVVVLPTHTGICD